MPQHSIVNVLSRPCPSESTATPHETRHSRLPEVTYRDLDLADLPAISSIHVAAFRDNVIAMLGEKVARQYYRWQLVGPHDVTAVGAFSKTKMLGYCFGGTFRGSLSGFIRKHWRRLAIHISMRPWLVTNSLFRKRIALGAQLVRRHGKRKAAAPDSKNSLASSFGILAIAVNPDSRGCGIGGSLLRLITAHAHQRGFQRMHLTVHPENSEVVEIYEHLGWKKVLNEGEWGGSMHRAIDASDAVWSPTERHGDSVAWPAQAGKRSNGT